MVENNLPFPQKAKHKITQQPSNFPPRYIPSSIESRDVNRCLYTNVHCSVIHSSQKMKAAHICINKWMDKQNVVYSYSGILFCHTTWMNTENMWSEISPSQNDKYYRIPLIWNTENRQNWRQKLETLRAGRKKEWDVTAEQL